VTTQIEKEKLSALDQERQAEATCSTAPTQKQRDEHWVGSKPDKIVPM
jgi:hypothetical protein